MRLVTVTAVDSGWALEAPGATEAALFKSGAAAEAAACRLAQGLADAGEAVKLVIRLRDGSEAGRRLFPPRLTAGEAVAWKRAA